MTSVALFENKKNLKSSIANLNRLKKSFMKKHKLSEKEINSIQWHKSSSYPLRKRLLIDFNKLRKRYIDMLIDLSIKRTSCKSCYVSIFGSEDLTSDYDVTITAGLRYDWYTSDDTPTHNQNFEDRYGYSNAQNLDGVDLIQPRFGFNWTASEQLEVRGGFG